MDCIVSYPVRDDHDMSIVPEICRLPEVSLVYAGIDEAAENLACLLIDTAEFQNYIRLARAVNLDPVVSELVEKLHVLQMSYFISTDSEGHTIEDLTQSIENLPVMQDYRKAESAVQEMFYSVDQIISQEAGVDFAANARSAFT